MFVIYIFSNFTRVRLRGKRMKNIPRSWVWADRFPFNDLFHAIIYFIAWINVDSSLSRGHWKLENCSRAKRERQFFLIFSNFLYFKEKFFYYSIKKKFLRISSINSHWSILSSNQCYHMPLNIRELMQSMKRIFFFKFHTRPISKGNFAQVWQKFHWIFVHRSTIISFIASLIYRSHIPSNTRKLHSTRVNGRIY